MRQPSKIHTIWLVGVPKDKHPEVINRVNQIMEDKVMDRLREILQEKYELVDTTFDYDQPNWSYRQAHANGQKEMINDLLNLIRKAD